MEGEEMISISRILQHNRKIPIKVILLIIFLLILVVPIFISYTSIKQAESKSSIVTIEDSNKKTAVFQNILDKYQINIAEPLPLSKITKTDFITLISNLPLNTELSFYVEEMVIFTSYPNEGYYTVKLHSDNKNALEQISIPQFEEKITNTIEKIGINNLREKTLITICLEERKRDSNQNHYFK
jgi:hypothetical protein